MNLTEVIQTTPIDSIVWKMYINLSGSWSSYLFHHFHLVDPYFEYFSIPAFVTPHWLSCVWALENHQHSILITIGRLFQKFLDLRFWTWLPDQPVTHAHASRRVFMLGYNLLRYVPTIYSRFLELVSEATVSTALVLRLAMTFHLQTRPLTPVRHAWFSGSLVYAKAHNMNTDHYYPDNRLTRLTWPTFRPSPWKPLPSRRSAIPNEHGIRMSS